MPTAPYQNLLERLALASRDARIVFAKPIVTHITVAGEPATITQAPVAESPTAEALRELDAASEAIQLTANALVATGDHDRARLLLILAANVTHAPFPQYVGHWDHHTLTIAARDIELHGRELPRGDVLLLDPRVSATDVAVYSVRMGSDLGLLDEDIEPLP